MNENLIQLKKQLNVKENQLTQFKKYVQPNNDEIKTKEIFTKGLNISDTLRVHLSFEKINKIYNIENKNQLGNPARSKPRGLYYSFGDTWLNFLFRVIMSTDEQIKAFVENELFLYEVIINKNVLQLKNAKELDIFQNKYHKYSKTKIIDWYRVSKDFCGIELSNYPLLYNKISDITFKKKKLTDLAKQYGVHSITIARKHMANFYNAWDVAGGCIWNKKCIKTIKLLYHKPKNTDRWVRII